MLIIWEKTKVKGNGYIDRPLIEFLQEWSTWGSSFYELALAFPDTLLNEQSYELILSYVWEDEHLQGVVCRPTEFGQSWKIVSTLSIVPPNHFYGCLHFDEKVVGCGSFFRHMGGFVWLVLYIPLAMLERIYPVLYTDGMVRETNS